MHVKPGQQAVDGKEPMHGAVRPGQGETAALFSAVRAVPDKHAEASAIDVVQGGEVGDAAGPRLPPYVAEAGLQSRGAAEIQFTGQAHHGHAVVITV
jgi:hypothetical protein